MPTSWAGLRVAGRPSWLLTIPTGKTVTDAWPPADFIATSRVCCRGEAASRGLADRHAGHARQAVMPSATSRAFLACSCMTLIITFSLMLSTRAVWSHISVTES